MRFLEETEEEIEEKDASVELCGFFTVFVIVLLAYWYEENKLFHKIAIVLPLPSANVAFKFFFSFVTASVFFKCAANGAFPLRSNFFTIQSEATLSSEIHFSKFLQYSHLFHLVTSRTRFFTYTFLLDICQRKFSSV